MPLPALFKGRPAVAAVALAFASSARAADFVQNAWQGGAVAGSTASLSAGLATFDSQDGNVVALSTAAGAAQSAPRSWTQTDDATGDSGFPRAGSVFSSATVLGAGTLASLQMVVEETVTVKAAQLPQARGDASALYHPTLGDVFVMGGSLDGALGDDAVFRYFPVSDSLVKLSTPLGLPRFGIGAAYHPGRNLFLLFYGQTSPGATSNIPQTYDPITETQGGDFFSGFGGGFLPAAYFPPNGLTYFFGGIEDALGGQSRFLAYDAVSKTSVPVNSVLPSSRAYMSAAYHPASAKIYLFGGHDVAGNDLDEILSYDPVADTMTVMAARLPSPRRKTAAVYFPPTGRILVFGGFNDIGATDEIVEYDPIGDTVTLRPVRLPTVRAGMAAAYADSVGRVYLFGGSSGPVSGQDDVLEYRAISSGVYTSSVFDTGNLSGLQTVAWSSALPAGTTLGVSVRAGDTPTPGGTWSNGGQFGAVANGASAAAIGPARYVQYSATFTTVNVSTTASLRDLTFSYTQTPASATLISTAFDTGYNSSRLKKILWQGTFPAGTTAQFQLRTASDTGAGFPATWTSFLGPTGIADFYTSPGGSDTINSTHRDGSNDRWFQYRLVLGSSNTANAATVSTVTVSYEFEPPAPTGVALTPDSSTQLTLQWTDASPNEDTFVISSGTASGPTNTGASIPTADKPGSGGSQSTVLSGLIPNTTYFARLRARVLPPDDLFSAYSSEVTTVTLAEAPAAAQASGVFLSSLTLSWSGGANPGTTRYELSLSTDSFQTNFSTPVPFTAGLTATTTGLVNLSPGTTYYLRVRARNSAGVPTSFSAVVATPTAPSGVAAPSGAALGVSSISWTWANAGPAASYRLTRPDFGTFVTVTTAPAFLETGLPTDTASALRVEPFTATASGGLSPPTTRYTLAEAPTGPFIGALEPIVVAWFTGSNPFGVTIYEVSASTDDFVANATVVVPISSATTAPAAVVNGLAPGTTYWFRVRAVNGDGVLSGFSESVATQTVPGAVASLAGAALGVSSIAWTWSATAGPTITSYDVFRASNGVFLGNATGTAFADTGLSTNAAYGVAVRARNGSGVGPLSAGATSFTGAALPTTAAVTGVFVSSVALSWSANTNPSGTVFEVQRSTDGASFSASGSVVSASHVVTALTGPSTYYFRVRAVSGDSVVTAFAATVSTFVFGTPPSPPVGLAAASAGGLRIRVDWGPSPSTSVVRYNLYFDSGTGVIDYSATLSTFAASATTFLSAPLSDGVTYRFGLRAQDNLGQEERNTSVQAAAAALASLTGVRVAIRAPAGGLRIAGDRVTVLAELVQGSAATVREVRFQYKASSAATWSDIVPMTTHANPDSAAPYYVHWSVNGLATANHDLRAVAVDSAGTADGAPPSVTLGVDLADFDLREFAIAGGRIQKDQRVYSSVANTLHASESDSALVTKLVLPAGALAASTGTVTLVNNPAALPADGAEVRGAGVAAEISLSGGQTTLAGGNLAVLTFAYADENGDGLVDGTLIRSDNLSIYAFDVPSGKWRKEAASTLDAINKTITATTSHFSFFGAFVPAHADLASLRVYPNPYKPNNASADDGTAYSPGSPNSGIIFDNLPDQVTIKIFTVSAQLVREISSNASGGRVQWDVKNDRGADVASGGYFAVINSPGQKAVVKRLGIVR